MQAVAILEADWREPLGVLATFADEPWAVGLLSGGEGDAAGWSYIARDPDAVLLAWTGDGEDPLAALRRLLGETAARASDGPPFQGGVMGLCAYELGATAEQLDIGRHGDWPDLACAHYPAVLAFDHRRGAILAVGRGADGNAAQTQATRALSWLKSPSGPALSDDALCDGVQAEPPAAYETALAEVIDRIAAGEIFQANIARAWHGRLKDAARPFDLLARLASDSPAPFAAYLRLEDKAVVSNSPERFVRVEPRKDGGGVVETLPIKGTAPRGRDAAEDDDLARALAASAKDRAENLMIVDLMRNDLARVCAPGTVETPSLFKVATYANVHHLVSKVTGRLEMGRDSVDLLRAALPAGSITGAPKRRAMTVIGELEAPRGPFFGVVFWADADGGLDSSVLIRTTAFGRDAEGWAFEARAGAGVTADSDPASERRETEDKIAAVLRALGAASSKPAAPLVNRLDRPSAAR